MFIFSAGNVKRGVPVHEEPGYAVMFADVDVADEIDNRIGVELPVLGLYHVLMQADTLSSIVLEL